MSEITERAHEIAAFLGIPEADAIERLSKGFHFQHAEVNADFRRANPQNDDTLLEWYRTTDSYIWELSAYHAEPGFNYAGMCKGIAERLTAEGANHVLCLGDGIGDLMLMLRKCGLDAVYHDLAGSRTAEFAKFRFKRITGMEMPFNLTTDWTPEFAWMNKVAGGDNYDAVVSLDFLEHVNSVESWVAEIKSALKPDGIFCAQNAFACGSGPDGSIPMHLARNDRFEHDWDPMLLDMGFVQQSSNWYKKAA